jgi:lipid II:glycine glycyltransferase (peptidoglycan interpeptide bridge formation enzyme)
METGCPTDDRIVPASNYQVVLSDSITDCEWDEFVSSQAEGHHVQTSLWAQVKRTLGYRALRVVLSARGRILAGGQFLIRQWSPLFAVAYMPKGPLLSTWDATVARLLTDEFKRIAQTHHFLAMALQPPNHDAEFHGLLLDQGFQPSWLELAPTATIFIDLTADSDQILKQMKRQTRQNIHCSEREGMTTREGTEADLPAYYRLHVATSRRQGFTPYPEEYFACMWRVFSERECISLIFAEFDNTPVSALLLVSFGDTVIPKTLGWSGEHAKRRPNDAVFWAAIRWAKDHGYRYFDLEGIDRAGAQMKLAGRPLPEALRNTPDFFKLGFGGRISLLPCSYCFVPSFLWRWPYHQIFSMKHRGQIFHRSFDRYRRRFG